MALDPVIGDYVEDGWGGVHNAKMAVLSDFFKVRDCPAVCCTPISCASKLELESSQGGYIPVYDTVSEGNKKHCLDVESSDKSMKEPKTSCRK